MVPFLACLRRVAKPVCELELIWWRRGWAGDNEWTTPADSKKEKGEILATYSYVP